MTRIPLRVGHPSRQTNAEVDFDEEGRLSTTILDLLKQALKISVDHDPRLQIVTPSNALDLSQCPSESQLTANGVIVAVPTKDMMPSVFVRVIGKGLDQYRWLKNLPEGKTILEVIKDRINGFKSLHVLHCDPNWSDSDFLNQDAVKAAKRIKSVT